MWIFIGHTAFDLTSFVVVSVRCNTHPYTHFHPSVVAPLFSSGSCLRTPPSACLALFGNKKGARPPGLLPGRSPNQTHEDFHQEDPQTNPKCLISSLPARKASASGPDRATALALVANDRRSNICRHTWFPNTTVRALAT